MANASLSRKFKRPSLMVFSELEPIQQTWAVASILSTSTQIVMTKFIGNGTTVVTGSSNTSHGLKPGDPITISGATGTQQNKLNGNWIVLTATTNNFTFVVTSALASGELTSDLGSTNKIEVQYTTSLSHDFNVGDEVQISGATVSGFNAISPKIITHKTTNTFKVASTATGATSTAIAYGTKWDFQGGEVLYLTDDNREPLQITPQRIEFKRRMIDGTMRSHYVADKDEYSTSWSDIPSRKNNGSVQITSDNFGAGNDIKSWYEENTGDFWILLIYDTNSSDNISVSAEKVNVFFNSFAFSVSTRGELNDLWDVSISLVEV
jgi:hypothetical protein